MLRKNSDAVMSVLKPADVVLDIGGWAHPFNRANYIMDAEPHETRGYYNQTFAKNSPIPPIGGTLEHFTKDSWIQRDICEKTPFPFRDKELDYVICSHTLEDIRDPLWVCAEMIRIAKRGYIEVPSRLCESCRGAEIGIVGLSHHRWLIDINGSSIRFLMKLHSIHGHWKYSLPAKCRRRLTEEQKVQSLFWEGEFKFYETTIYGPEAQEAELERFVRSIRPYHALPLEVDRIARWARQFVRRGNAYIHRLVRGHGPSPPPAEDSTWLDRGP
jgi:hypothetical protein